jgi:hypothetical protein
MVCREEKGQAYTAAMCLTSIPLLHQNQNHPSYQNTQYCPRKMSSPLKCSKDITLSGHTSDLETLVHCDTPTMTCPRSRGNVTDLDSFILSNIDTGQHAHYKNAQYVLKMRFCPMRAIESP